MIKLQKGEQEKASELERAPQVKQATDTRFLAGSQGRLQELEQDWARKRVVYQQQLEREGTEIQRA